MSANPADYLENPSKTEEPKPKAPWDETIRTLIWAVVIAVVFRSFLFEPFHIPSGSMKSNLLVGDYLFVSKFSYGYSRYSLPFGLPLWEGRVLQPGRPQRGDVVVFRPVPHPGTDYIKRIIGLPGDRIQVKQGITYINDTPLPREEVDVYTDLEDSKNPRKALRLNERLPEGKIITILKERNVGPANNTGVYTVPEGNYFMMGDNRDNSGDSRFPKEVGFVPEENIVGKAQIIFFSTDGSAKFWEVWKWFPSLRLDRFLKWIH